MAACENGPKNDTTGDSGTSAPSGPDMNVPAVMGYNIVEQYPHDTKAFTEGLEYIDGVLYESVGRYGRSDIRKVDAVTGKVLQQTKMEDRYFGEGLTVMNGKIYQLTYREGKGFVYDLATMKKVSTFDFPTQEGWGMTNNGTHLIFSDGSNKLYFMDPASMKVVKQLSVTDEQGPVNRINELELINGYIYANQWQADLILKIDTTTGRVTARADLSTIRMQGGIPPNANDEEAPETMNGIAYDAKGNRIFVTGKNWPKMFVVKLDN
ncbi:hypothetical protein GCM10023093_28810 [Nemorincola caseinilytica]|uniref:Glutaminyl-peptide cyclotransferase n=2 Tax=Nemorincola caseinilytica TaxID=2054315 RepID=A0ABP8NPX7_9BACT